MFIPALALTVISLLVTGWSWRQALRFEAAPATFLASAGARVSSMILVSGLIRSLAVFALVCALMLARKLAVSRRVALAEVDLGAKVFANCSEGICITDAGNRILSVNPAFIRMTGYSLEEVLGQDPRILSSHRQDQAFYERAWTTLLSQGRWQGEIWDRRKDGEVYPKWMTIDTVRDDAGEIVNFVAIASDISERISAEANLRHVAEHDPLTGLPNRVLLRDRFLQAKARAERQRTLIGILFLDLDHFKQINDTHGHAAGDLLLQQIAGRLTPAVRASDTVTRIGGDEFIVMLPDLEHGREIAAISDKLLKAVRAPYHLDGKVLDMTFSVGSCCFPEHGTTMDQLFRCADQAMYSAKRGGRNQVRSYAPGMDGESRP
jgi:diguanylate cyclase (GGDEF)-like protein/PAS domain S-box-containing protein